MKYRVLSLALALATLIFLTALTPASAQDSSAAAVQANSGAVHPDEQAARSASGKPLVDADRADVPPLVHPPQTAVACNICFTCGGDWPIFAGAIHAVNTGSLTFERGGSCSGNLAAANDQNPFLCCR